MIHTKDIYIEQEDSRLRLHSRYDGGVRRIFSPSVSFQNGRIKNTSKHNNSYLQSARLVLYCSYAGYGDCLWVGGAHSACLDPLVPLMVSIVKTRI